MATMKELERAVDEAFNTKSTVQAWSDPHDGSPAEDSYSRVTDPERYRLFGERAEAWIAALQQFDLATVQRGVEVAWPDPHPDPVRVDLVGPTRSNALRLLIGRFSIGDAADAGLVLGVGDPVAVVRWWPDCGCDACDSGSQHVVDDVDEHFSSLVSGTFRHLVSGKKVVTALGDRGVASTGLSPRKGGARAVLNDPTGWDDYHGASWFS